MTTWDLPSDDRRPDAHADCADAATNEPPVRTRRPGVTCAPEPAVGAGQPGRFACATPGGTRPGHPDRCYASPAPSRPSRNATTYSPPNGSRPSEHVRRQPVAARVSRSAPKTRGEVRRHGVDDPAVDAGLGSQVDERVVEQAPLRHPERDVGQAAGQVDRAAVLRAELAGRLEDVAGASGATATGRTSGSTNSRSGAICAGDRRLDRGATALATRSSALAGMPPALLAGEDHRAPGRGRELQDLGPLDRRGVEEQPARAAAWRPRRPPPAPPRRTSRSTPGRRPSPRRSRPARSWPGPASRSRRRPRPTLRSSQSAPVASWRAASARM